MGVAGAAGTASDVPGAFAARRVDALVRAVVDVGARRDALASGGTGIRVPGDIAGEPAVRGGCVLHIFAHVGLLGAREQPGLTGVTKS